MTFKIYIRNIYSYLKAIIIVAHDILANKTFKRGMTLLLFIINYMSVKISISFIIHAKYICLDFRLNNKTKNKCT